MKFRKLPIIIEATQWFKNGDHPKDESRFIDEQQGTDTCYLTEGKIVRRYCTPSLDGKEKCNQCGGEMQHHGWIDTPEGGHIVCKGDWIITGVAGEYYPCKDSIFKATYERMI